MNPLLLAGVSTLANRLVNNTPSETPSAPAAPSAKSFKQTLAGILSQQDSSPSTSPDLKQRLLESPEVRDALAKLDLTQVTSLELSPNGSLVAVSPRGRVEIALSEGTKTVARHLFTQEALARATKLAAESGSVGINPQTPVSIALSAPAATGASKV